MSEATNYISGDDFVVEFLGYRFSFNAIDFDLLRKHIGPSVWRVQSIDDGFLMHSFTLAVAPKAAN